MIHHHIQLLNDELASILPKDCGEPLWKTQLNGLAQLIWDSQDRARKLHDGGREFVVVDDKYDLQTVHVIDGFGKIVPDEMNPFDGGHRIRCSWLGVGKKPTAALMAGAVFDRLKGTIENITYTTADTNTENVIVGYWGVNRENWGQNPEYYAFRIQYSYTLPELLPEDLYALEGISSFDPVS